MTDDETAEKLVAAAHTARAAGRRVVVLSASKADRDALHAEYVGIAMVDDLLRDGKMASMLSLPRRDAELLMLDLHQTLNGKFQTIEQALQALVKKGGASA